MIIYANLIYKFTKDDKILILWSSWSREDRIKNKRWNNGGSIFSESYFDRKFIKTHWDIDNDLVKNATAIISANALFKENIVWQGNWADPFIPEDFEDYPHPSNNLMLLYKSAMPAMDCYKLDGVELAFGGLVPDGHPDIRRHLKFVREVILPVFSKSMDVATENAFNDIYNEIMLRIKTLRKAQSCNIDVCLQEIMKIMDHHTEIYEFIHFENMNDLMKD